MLGQLGGNSGLLGTRWVSITGEVAGDPQDAGFSKRAGEERHVTPRLSFKAAKPRSNCLNELLYYLLLHVYFKRPHNKQVKLTLLLCSYHSGCRRFCQLLLLCSPCSLSCSDIICSVCFRLAIFSCWFSCSICNKIKAQLRSHKRLSLLQVMSLGTFLRGVSIHVEAYLFKFKGDPVFNLGCLLLNNLRLLGSD